MGDPAQSPTQIITLPKGGGAVRGIGETFTADPQSGTGSFAVPLTVPAGRRGFQPALTLRYGTGTGAGYFGLGWSLSVPGITRKTSRGVPTYHDDTDTFILSGQEDLVEVGPTADGGIQYRPRTEGLYATIVHHRSADTDFWEVTGTDGLVSRYGSLPAQTPGWTDPAVLAAPADAPVPGGVFAWKLTETRDPLGNLIVYEYETDTGEGGGHRWRQPLLRAIRYADYDDAGQRRFFATVTFADEARDDAFSSYTAGFEIRTTRRYTTITIAVHPGVIVPVRRYELRYTTDPHNRMSLLHQVEAVGFADDGQPHHDLPPVELSYSRLDTDRRRFQPIGGDDLPMPDLSDPGYELVDLNGDGLPDILQCDGTTRYWRNRGDGSFDRPRPMRNTPAGAALGTRGVQLLDADGDGRASLMVVAGPGAAVYPLRHDASWGPPRIRAGATPELGDPQVKLVDLDGDGVTDALQSGTGLTCWFDDPVHGWSGPRPVQLPAQGPLPPADLTDPRVRIADMVGDNLADLVLIAGRQVSYWPNLGRGRFGPRIRMTGDLALPAGYDPARLQLGDLDGDGLADLVFVDADQVTVWINQGGNRWGEPIVLRGLPTSGWDVRIADLLGTGTGGLLCSRAGGTRRPAMYFLDLTGGMKPRLLTGVDNHIGAVTTIEYASSTSFAIRDHADPATRWRTPLPFPVPVVHRIRDIDLISHTSTCAEYSYRHGYWDGHDREFRGFARVEQADTEVGAAGPSRGVNLVYNAAIRRPGEQQSTRLAVPGTAPAAAAGWSAWNPVNAVTDTSWTAERGDGPPTLRVTTDSAGCGLVQEFAHSGYGPVATAAVWVKVGRGKVALELDGIGNVSRSLGRWELLSAGAGDRSDRLAVVAVGEGGADFLVRDAGVRPRPGDTLVRNGDFRLPHADGPVVLSGLHGGPSAAPLWSVWHNLEATTTTEMTEQPPAGRDRAMHVVTTAGSGGLVQAFLHTEHGPDSVLTSAWVYVVHGQVAIGTGNGGHTGPDVSTTTTGEWELLQARNRVAPANEVIVYARDGAAEFYVAEVTTRPVDAPEAPVGRPVVTRTWFDVGPVESAGGWAELDLGDEYWPGDPSLFDRDGAQGMAARRDALRALRGRVLRSEVYALDGSLREGQPYTVTEHAYALRPEPADGIRPVWSAFDIAQRETQWLRGDDPLTRFAFTGDHDDVGQPGRQTRVAVPRRSAYRTPITTAVVGSIEPDPTTVLATHKRTRYATGDDAGYIRDRVADVRTYQLTAPVGVAETDPDDVGAVLADQYATARQVRDTFDALQSAEVELIKQILHHYDGSGYTGLEAGLLGDHGLLTRTEVLIGTDATFDDAYGTWRPAYLDGTAPLPVGAPPLDAEGLGYRRETASPWYADGWYADTVRRAYDVQLSTAAAPLPARGLPIATQDSLGNETHTEIDDYWLAPILVRDPAGLETTIEPHYRTGQPRHVTDPNGTRRHFRFHPLGMLAGSWRAGTDGRAGTEDIPEVSHLYDLTAFRDNGRPISVRSVQRVHYATDGVSDDTIETWEYSDGFGRVVQKRARADELSFGSTGDEVGLLVPDPAGGPPRPVPGEVGGPAVATRQPDRMLVSGWQVYDNKGRVVRKHEPFPSAGAAYEEDAAHGMAVQMEYDPLGRLTRILNPDGSRRVTVPGTPVDLTDPEEYLPTPWVTTEYDENDLAPMSVDPTGTSIGRRVPAEHHFTPATTIRDAADRTVCRVVRGGSDPGTWRSVRTTYDACGNVLSVVDEFGRIGMTHAYDLCDRTLRTDSLDGGRRITVLDAADNQCHTRDARGAQTFRQYDELNRLRELSACDRTGAPLTVRERLTYGDEDPDRDAAYKARRLGLLWQHLDEAGRLTIDGYDLTGAITEQIRRVISDGALAAVAPGSDWVTDWATMDPAAVLDEHDDRTSTRNDALGRALEVTSPEGADGHRTALHATFDEAGLLRAVHRDNGAGASADDVRLLVRNARGQRVFIALGNGLITRYAYDPYTFRLVRLRTEPATVTDETWSGTGPAVQDLTYTYDLAGNVTTVEDGTPACGIANSSEGRDRLVRTFTYDPFNRLVWATGRECASIAAARPPEDLARCGAFAAPYNPPPAAPTQKNAPDLTVGYQETYTYDVAGNLIDLHHRPLATGTGWHRRFGLGGLSPKEWADARDNRLTSMNAGMTTNEFGYDSAGNQITQDQSRTYRWDHAGRFVGFRVHAGAGTSVAARYLYAANGVRVKKWVRRNDSPALEDSTVYIGDVFERHTWKKSGGGQHTLVHVMDDRMRVAVVRSGIAHPDGAGPPTWYDIEDHLGNATVTVDASGDWLNREEFFPYGETSFGGYARKPYRFIGRERDEESGLSYHTARYYSPATSRWITCDPAGQIDNSTLYAYAAGNPMRYIDPSGHYSEAGHFYTVYFVSLAAGFPEEVAYRNAAFAQLPDEVDELDAISMQIKYVLAGAEVGSENESAIPKFLKVAERRDAVQRGIHALTGESSAAERHWTRNALLQATPGTPEFGLLAHRFGDSYGHSIMGKESTTYMTGYGHAWDLTRPDQIATRNDLYEKYVMDLFTTFSAVAMKQGFSPRLNPVEAQQFAHDVATERGFVFMFPESPYPVMKPLEEAQISLMRDRAATLFPGTGGMRPYAPEKESKVSFQEQAKRHPDFMKDNAGPLQLKDVDKVIPVHPLR